MRCKNCGTENDDNRYICENCGSPLYDEDEFEINEPDAGRTQSFRPVNNEPYDNYNGNNGNYNGTNDRFAEPVRNNGANRRSENNRENKAAEKKNIIIIAVLAIILIAIIVSIIAVANGKKENGEVTSPELTKISDEMSSGELSTERTTDRTTEKTTEKTTKETTKATTTISTWYINTSSSGGGSASGAGEYKNGAKVVLVATPDSGYTFDGWYSNGVKVSDKKKYTFTANQNASFSAVFEPVTTQQAPAEPDTSSGDLVFGE